MKKDIVVCVVGLGYVGLPLAVELAKYFKVYGFDVNKKRVDILKKTATRTARSRRPH